MMALIQSAVAARLSPTKERAYGFLVAGGDCSPLFQACPEGLNQVAVGVDPAWAGDFGVDA